MTATTSDTRQLPRPMIDWFASNPALSKVSHEQLRNQVFHVKPCQPAPDQPVIDAILVADLYKEG